MTTIGAGWKKQDRNGKHYISISIDEELLDKYIKENMAEKGILLDRKYYAIVAEK